MIAKDVIGKRIRQLREKQGLTREAFCDDESQLTVRQLQRIEVGESLPTLIKLSYIVSVLKASVSDIISEEWYILPDRYLYLKDKIVKFSTYGDEERIAQKELYFDEIYEHFYDELPEEEQITIDALRAKLDMFCTQNYQFSESLIDDYFYQITRKYKYSSNDLLIIDMYLHSVLHKKDNQDMQLVELIWHNIMNQIDDMETETLFYVKRLLLTFISIPMCRNEYDVKKYIDLLRDVMKKSNDFTQRAIVDMFEAKYELHVMNNVSGSKKLYDNALVAAKLVEDDVLHLRIAKELCADIKCVVV